MVEVVVGESVVVVVVVVEVVARESVVVVAREEIVAVAVAAGEGVTTGLKVAGAGRRDRCAPGGSVRVLIVIVSNRGEGVGVADGVTGEKVIVVVVDESSTSRDVSTRCAISPAHWNGGGHQEVVVAVLVAGYNASRRRAVRVGIGRIEVAGAAAREGTAAVGGIGGEATPTAEAVGGREAPASSDAIAATN